MNGGVQGVSNRTSLISHPSSDPSVNTTMTYQTAQGNINIIGLKVILKLKIFCSCPDDTQHNATKIKPLQISGYSYPNYLTMIRFFNNRPD